MEAQRDTIWRVRAQSQNTVIITVPVDAADLEFFGDGDLL